MKSSRRDFLKFSLSVLGGALASQLPGIPQMGGLTAKPFLLKPAIAYESLLLGVKRYSPMILDNFGLTINMNDIAPWQELTEEERRTAFTNHVLSKVDPETEVRARERLA